VFPKGRFTVGNPVAHPTGEIPIFIEKNARFLRSQTEGISELLNIYLHGSQIETNLIPVELASFVQVLKVLVSL
jgi:hypothetical protein